MENNLTLTIKPKFIFIYYFLRYLPAFIIFYLVPLYFTALAITAICGGSMEVFEENEIHILWVYPLFCVVKFFLYKGTYCSISDKKVISTSGYLYKKELPTESIMEITCKQGFLQKLFSIGDVSLIIHPKKGFLKEKTGITLFNILNLQELNPKIVELIFTKRST